jgi:hypothetical protein
MIHAAIMPCGNAKAQKLTVVTDRMAAAPASGMTAM